MSRFPNARNPAKVKKPRRARRVVIVENEWQEFIARYVLCPHCGEFVKLPSGLEFLWRETDAEEDQSEAAEA